MGFPKLFGFMFQGRCGVFRASVRSIASFAAKQAEDRQRGPRGAFVWRGRQPPHCTAGRNGHYRAALGRGSRYRMKRLRHRGALLDGNSRKLRRPTGNIQFSNYQEDGGIGYRQHCADQIASVVVHCSPHTEIQMAFANRTLMQRIKFRAFDFSPAIGGPTFLSR